MVVVVCVCGGGVTGTKCDVSPSSMCRGGTGLIAAEQEQQRAKVSLPNTGLLKKAKVQNAPGPDG